MAVLNPYNYARPKGAPVKRPVGARTITPVSNQNGNGNTAAGDQYLEQKVMSSSPEELTLMLYEGAIKFIKQAKIFNSDKQIEKTSNAMLRAQAIYTELQSTLNLDYDISNEFDQLYEYILRRLMEANLEKSNEILDEVLELSIEFRDTWKEAMKKAK